MLNPIQAVQLAVKNQFNFRGRARRSEYWWTTLVWMLIFLALLTFDEFTFVGLDTEVELYGWQGFLDNFRYYPLSTGFEFLTYPMVISLGFRRLHDIGRRGWPVILATIITLYTTYLNPDDILSLLGLAVLEPDTPKQDVFGLIIFNLCAIVATFLLWIYITICAIFDSQKGLNKFGPNPKGIGNVDMFD